MLSMLPGYRRAALLIAAGAAASLPVFAQTAATPAPSASAPSGAGDAAPSERAKRDAEKVFHWIMIQGDRARKTSASSASAKDTKDGKDGKDERPAPAKPVVATRSSNAPGRATADPVPEVVLRPRPEAVVSASAPNGSSELRAAAVDAPKASATKPDESATARPARAEATSTPPAVAEPPSDDSPVTLVPIAQSEPQFPVAAMRTLRRGSVQVRFSVQTDGSVADLEVLQSTSPRLNAAALAAIAQWRFQPIARVQTGAVEVGFSLD